MVLLPVYEHDPHLHNPDTKRSCNIWKMQNYLEKKKGGTKKQHIDSEKILKHI